MDMDKYLEQEKALVLDGFSYEDAWIMGTVGRSIAIEKKLPITICIEKNGQVVFQSALEGTSPINDKWLKRKREVVKLTHHSSIVAREEVGIKQCEVNQSIIFDKNKYACVGGSIPIVVKDIGCIGTLSVSGLSDEMDHEVAILILKMYKQVKKG